MTMALGQFSPTGFPASHSGEAPLPDSIWSAACGVWWSPVAARHPWSPCHRAPSGWPLQEALPATSRQAQIPPIHLQGDHSKDCRTAKIEASRHVASATQALQFPCLCRCHSQCRRMHGNLKLRNTNLSHSAVEVLQTIVIKTCKVDFSSRRILPVIPCHASCTWHTGIKEKIIGSHSYINTCSRTFQLSDVTTS